MSDEKKEKKLTPSEQLVIVSKDKFSVLEDNPIDALDSEIYARLEKLTSWFVLRAPLSEITKLADPGSIGLFKTDKNPKKGSRALNRASFDEGFLSCPDLDGFDLDCTQFEFVYKRIAVKPQLETLSLFTNESDVFQSTVERAVCFIGRGTDSSNEEDSCIESICRHVRNALAHGRIAVKVIDDEPFIFLEDGSNPKDVDYGGNKPSGSLIEVRFRMLVRVSTLETWHEILLSDETR